jgi:hypothetical protein
MAEPAERMTKAERSELGQQFALALEASSAAARREAEQRRRDAEWDAAGSAAGIA